MSFEELKFENKVTDKKELEAKKEETLEERNARMAKGEITDREISEYLTRPEDVLFEHKLIAEKAGDKLETNIKVRALTESFSDSTLENLKDSWDDVSFENLKKTLSAYFEQKKSGKPGLLNVEYYIATDQQDNPIGMTGLYTVDIQGGTGFATKNNLDPEKHNLNMGLGWYSVGKNAQGTGIGKYLLEWSENLARSRGAAHFEIETDDWKNSEKARRMYKKSGYKEGLSVKDFYGPGRDLCVYYCDCSKQKEVQHKGALSEINADNKDQILQIAQRNYSPERFEEFKKCLDIFFIQDKNRDAILVGHSVVLQGPDGVAESFAIYVDGIYDNCIPVYWMGTDASNLDTKLNLLSALKSISRAKGKDIIMICNENEDTSLPENDFTQAKHGVPGVFGKGDETQLLVFTKKLKENNL